MTRNIKKRLQKKTNSWADSREISAESIQTKKLCKTAMITVKIILFPTETTPQMSDTTAEEIIATSENGYIFRERKQLALIQSQLYLFELSKNSSLRRFFQAIKKLKS